MTDISITAANVVAGENSSRDTGSAGEAITAGQPVYKAATGKWMLADSNSATAAARKAGGIALNSASLNQPLAVHKAGDITIGGTLTPGVAYYLSDTPGGICPVADIGAGEYVCLLGIAKSASVLAVGIQAPGVAL
ncbi:hypothetical protein [Aminobacter niigataensis]|uniref:hypothetical protein n=1 Tax=Aminobacter niigataensis TaxID=83265 RepID=UPI0024C79DE8|nr:hypothetical protein [Aminobacter niigataensis]CAI2935027.1 conserved protein of unknown function [Aminobacter niigataensis]